MGPAEERIERRPQFVRQGCEEVFLEAIRVLRIAIEQRVVEGECGTGGDIGGEGEIAIVVTSRGNRSRGQQSERATAGAGEAPS